MTTRIEYAVHYPISTDADSEWVIEKQATWEKAASFVSFVNLTLIRAGSPNRALLMRREVIVGEWTTTGRTGDGD